MQQQEMDPFGPHQSGKKVHEAKPRGLTRRETVIGLGTATLGLLLGIGGNTFFENSRKKDTPASNPNAHPTAASNKKDLVQQLAQERATKTIKWENHMNELILAQPGVKIESITPNISSAKLRVNTTTDVLGGNAFYDIETLYPTTKEGLFNGDVQDMVFSAIIDYAKPGKEAARVVAEYISVTSNIEGNGRTIKHSIHGASQPAYSTDKPDGNTLDPRLNDMTESVGNALQPVPKPIS